MAIGQRKARKTSGASDEQRRWEEMALKMKFNSCLEAEKFWQGDWSECPVCGARLKLYKPLDNDSDYILTHKDRNLLIN